MIKNADFTRSDIFSMTHASFYPLNVSKKLFKWFYLLGTARLAFNCLPNKFLDHMKHKIAFSQMTLCKYLLKNAENTNFSESIQKKSKM